jgi:hypothetical protein
MNQRLQQLLKEEAARSLVHSACVVSRMDFIRLPAERVTDMVRRQLVSTAVNHAADNKLLDAPNAVEMRERVDKQATEFHTRLYMMTPKELENLLKLAYEEGQRSRGMF